MKYEDLIQSVLTAPLQEMRTQTETFVEVVMTVQNAGSLEPVLTDFFGAAVKPAGKEPTREIRDSAESYGGIWKNQTMYLTAQDNIACAAMLWPWSDGETVTLKLFRSRPKKS